MAQIIKHRRGTLESLSAVTGSLLKGEIVIATGSSNIAPSNGESVVFVASADGRVEAVNRIMRGASVPNTFAAGTYNGLMDGVPYYASASNVVPTLYLFGSGVNESINLIGNIQPFSGSVSTTLISLQNQISTLSGSNLAASLDSINLFTASANIRLNNLESKSASVDISVSNINSFTASQQTKDSTLASYTGSIDTKWNTLQNVTSSILSFTASQETKDSTLASYTGSINSKFTTLESVTASVSLRLSNLESKSSSVDISISNLNTFSSSQITKDTTLASYTGSIDTKFTTLASYTGSIDTKFTTLASYTGSIDTKWTTLAGVTSSLLSKTGSYATTGSNTFNGTQIVSGSMYVTGDLVVIGSSSFANISGSIVNIGTNTILLNTYSPAVRFGGISVIDSGSSAQTGSLLWDSLNNKWIYSNPSAVGYSGGRLISGPQNTGTLGNEVGLTTGRIIVAVGDDHISGSQISDDGTTVTIPGALTVGTLTGIGVVATFSTSVDSRLDSLEASIGGGAVSTRLDNLELFTSSQNTKNTTLAAYTGSNDTKWTTLASVTSSLNASSASQQISIDALNVFSASQITKDSTLASYTGSNDTKWSSLATYTGSIDTKWTTLANVTASILSFTASQESKDSTLAAYTGSNDTKWSTLLNVTSSILSFTSSVNTKFTDLATYTGSINTKFTDLATYTGSVNTKFTDLATYTGSVNTKFSTLENVTSSILSFTASQNTKNTTLASYTASIDTKFSTLQTYTSSLLTELNSYTSSLKTAISVAGSDLTVLGNAIVNGDLTIQGNTVTLNTSNLVVEDKLIVLASGSTNAAQADGSGILISGSGASFTYAATPDAWTANRPFSGSAFTGSLNVPGGASSKRIAFRGTTDNIEFVAAPTTAGDLVQWDGSGFVMSNIIDGGSF